MDDVTFYRTPQEAAEQLKYLSNRKPALASDCILRFSRQRLARRALVCSCFGGAQIAVTARKIDAHVSRVDASCSPPREFPRRDHLLVWPADRNSRAARRNERENGPILDRIFDTIAAENPGGWRGLLVIAGETGSRKSTYLRGLARRYVNAALCKSSRKFRPHVVTYEDPIETWFATRPEDASRAGFEYTPRQRGIDVLDLRHATTDALRQRPTLLVVGEVRLPEDWLSLLEFAGTGHFTITTTHAGSLTEAFERVVLAAGAHTPAKRSELASRIAAVVHLKAFDKYVLPSMWVRTARSRSGFVRDGLAGIIPNPEDGCYGRAHFAEDLDVNEILTSAIVEDLRAQ